MILGDPIPAHLEAVLGQRSPLREISLLRLYLADHLDAFNTISSLDWGVVPVQKTVLGPQSGLQPDTSTTPLPMRYASMGYTSIGISFCGICFYKAFKCFSIDCTVVRNT